MAAGARSGMGIASLILIAGSIVLLFFVVLSGVKHTTPLGKTYFLQADTSTIAGARPLSQWTYFYVCGEGNTNCGKPIPDLPIGAAWVGGGSGAPAALLGSHYKATTSKYYYYMWRFGWVFYLLALIFAVLAFFTALLSPFSRLASGLAGAMTAFALFWMTFAASLMTAVFVKARNVFRAAGLSASIGKYAFGFTWGAWAALFIASILLFLGVCFGGNRNKYTQNRNSGVIGANGLARNESVHNNNTGFFRRQRKVSERKSFVDNDSGRRVKEEYA